MDTTNAAEQDHDPTSAATTAAEDVPAVAAAAGASPRPGPNDWGTNPHVDDGLREVHVLGFTNSKRDAPWDRWQEPGVEIWGLNNLHVADDVPVDRCHRWFDIHPADVITSDPAHVEWLRANTGQRPTYLFHSAKAHMEGDPWRLESLIEFPVDEVVSLFTTRYFTNSISWMIAYAAYRMQPALERAKRWDRVVKTGTDLGWGDDDIERALRESGFDPDVPPVPPLIGIHGVDMATDTEYGAQRPSCEYIVGICAGAGYRIQIARASDLLSSAELYGVDDNGKLRAKLLSRQAEYREALANATNAKNAAVQEQVRRDAEINHINGALADVTYWLDRWTMPEIDREKASKPGQLSG